MAKNKKQPTKTIQLPQTPKQYLVSGRARKLPIHECLINDNWQEIGLATIMVTRRHINGRFTFGTYLIDVFCLGLKQTNYFFNQNEEEYEFLKAKVFSLQDDEMTLCEYNLAHNIIFGAIEYADSLGFKSQDDDWKLSKYVLEEDNDNVELIEIEFGQFGKPTYMVGPYDNANRIIAQLTSAVGEGNFEVVYMDDEDDDWDEEDELPDDDDTGEFDDFEEVKE